MHGSAVELSLARRVGSLARLATTLKPTWDWAPTPQPGLPWGASPLRTLLPLVPAMVNDLYVDAARLRRELDAQGLISWASRVDEVLTGGATGTEIVMGLRWISSQLRGIALDASTRDLVNRIHNTAEALLK